MKAPYADSALAHWRLRSRAAPFKVACSPTIPGLQANGYVLRALISRKRTKEDAMATERQREIKRRRKRREKRLKARIREARRKKKKK
jgi:hypothetical protein